MYVYSNDDYRHIALASVISKLVEAIILDSIEMYMNTNPNQFGFKRKHGTDQCSCVRKDMRHMWINAGNPSHGPVFDLHVKCKSRFKYALRFIKNNGNMLPSTS